LAVWDAFISHASEDKETVAIPLAAAMRRAGARVWLDRFELRVGDSLREKIDEGLAESRFGIVVLSPDFLRKGWPRRELNGLFALEESGRKVLLPVWHGITKADLAKQSPLLADRLAVDTSRGIQAVCWELIGVILDPGSESPSVASPGLAMRLRTLLDGHPDLNEITDFLAAHPAIIRTAVGVDSDASLLWTADLPVGSGVTDFFPGVAVGDLWRTTRRRSWQFLALREPDVRLLDDNGEVTSSIAGVLDALSAWRHWIRTHRAAAASSFADLTLDFPCTVVAGRRGDEESRFPHQIAELNDSLIGTRIRTYDWLVEAAAQLDEGRRR
jgi:hypothetical protein